MVLQLWLAAVSSHHSLFRCVMRSDSSVADSPRDSPQVRDAIYGAIRMPIAERHIRHENHWKYVSSHTVQFWAKVRKQAAGCWLPDVGGTSAT